MAAVHSSGACALCLLRAEPSVLGPPGTTGTLRGGSSAGQRGGGHHFTSYAFIKTPRGHPVRDLIFRDEDVCQSHLNRTGKRQVGWTEMGGAQGWEQDEGRPGAA